MHRRKPGADRGRAERPPRLLRVAASHTVSALAVLLLWFSLVLPHGAGRIEPAAFIQLPLAGLVVLALALVLRPRPRRAVALLFGVLLGALVVAKLLNLGFGLVLRRRFDLLNDWSYLDAGVGVLADSNGRGWAAGAVAVAALLAVAALTLVPLAVLRLSRLAAQHRRRWAPVLVALGAVWAVCAVAGLQPVPHTNAASRATGAFAWGEVRHVHADLVDRRVFARAIAADRFSQVPDDRLLRALRGRDVLLVFVESYGRAALEDPGLAPRVDAVLTDATARLHRAGFASRSAFLTSPTFGAGSWLAHSTLQSGLWVNSQQRYDQLMAAHRLTLTSAFDRAGWRTVFDLPAVPGAWPQGRHFYRFDAMLGEHDVGYHGPAFGWATMPDQFTLAQFGRRELTPAPRRRVFAEIDLVSSHHPWTPLPHMVPWDELGDGSIFTPMAKGGPSSFTLYHHVDRLREHYARTIAYSLRAVTSFLARSPDPHLVVVMLGDHQPLRSVTGAGVSHDVPVSVIARDPAVLRRIAGWGWEPGLHPAPDAPVWPMDTFRDRFLTAFDR